MTVMDVVSGLVLQILQLVDTLTTQLIQFQMTQQVYDLHKVQIMAMVHGVHHLVQVLHG